MEEIETTTVAVADVEGSTPLLERLGESRYGAALAAYEELLSALLAEHGGVQEISAGDGHICSFRSARAALAWAVALERALPSPQIPFKVRIGVHSGDLERRDGRLYGRAMVKAARIGALAHGGEVLLSATARDVADLADTRDMWCEEGQDVELRGLRGRHRVVPLRWEDRERAPERVVVADDTAIIRDGVAALLRENGLDVVATAGDAEALHDAIARHAPDVALVDIRMPPTWTNEGLVAAERIRSEHPEIAVLVLSQHVEPAYALDLIRDGEGHSGYLLKDRIADVDILLDAVRRVARGGCVVDPALTEDLVHGAEARGLLAELDDREREVLDLIAQGLPNRVIAERLGLSEPAVQDDTDRIFRKLGLDDLGGDRLRVAAVIAYLRSPQPRRTFQPPANGPSAPSERRPQAYSQVVDREEGPDAQSDSQ
jgi:DNA-binding NarL/FixJ family response regulator/class 3 adenylate cyclase